MFNKNSRDSRLSIKNMVEYREISALLGQSGHGVNDSPNPHEFVRRWATT